MRSDTSCERRPCEKREEALTIVTSFPPACRAASSSPPPFALGRVVLQSSGFWPVAMVTARDHISSFSPAPFGRCVPPVRGRPSCPITFSYRSPLLLDRLLNGPVERLCPRLTPCADMAEKVSPSPCFRLRPAPALAHQIVACRNFSLPIVTTRKVRLAGASIFRDLMRLC